MTLSSAHAFVESVESTVWVFPMTPLQKYIFFRKGGG